MEPTIDSAPAHRSGRIVLIRHGQTEWSRSGRHTSSSDIDLTDAGCTQATELAPMLASWRFAQIRVSPLRRAQHTAQVAGLHDPRPIIDPNLKEWDYGEYEGITSAEIHEFNPGWTIFSANPPGGETIEQVAQRADRVLDACAKSTVEGGDVALVAHGHFLRVLGARWLQHSGTFGAHLGLDAASISVLSREHDVPILAQWNLRPPTHLVDADQSVDAASAAPRVNAPS